MPEKGSASAAHHTKEPGKGGSVVSELGSALVWHLFQSMRLACSATICTKFLLPSHLSTVPLHAVPLRIVTLGSGSYLRRLRCSVETCLSDFVQPNADC